MIAEQLDELPSLGNDDGISPVFTPYTGFTDMFDTNALAPSPEHPTFGGGPNGSWILADAEGGLFHDFTPPGPSPALQSWHPTNDVPTHSLSHVSSASSLNSLYSYPGVDANDDVTHSMDDWMMPVHIPAPTPIMQQCSMPSLQLDTQGLGKAGPRLRSSSRARPYLPYQRERSLSLSEEGEELGALHSAMSPQSAFGQPWANPIVNGVGKMSLHHRRTSSNTSAFSQRISPMSQSLARAHRSGSMAVQRPNDSSCEVILTGSAEDRENTVRSALGDNAKQVKLATYGTQQDKARTTWVRQWLRLCYSRNEGSTVPRQGLYHSYSLSCQEYGVRPVNSASFGKAVKVAFPGIKTRRLGHRGNSKYHYVSLRPSIRIEAVRLNDFGDSSGQWHVAPEDGTMGFQPQQGIEMDEEDVDDTEIEEDQDSLPSYKHASMSVDIRGANRPIIAMNRRHTTTSIPFTSTFESIAVYNLPGFPSFTDVNVGNLTEGTVAFWQSFCQHQDLLAGYIRSLRFDQFDFACRTFWAQRSPIDMEICQHAVVSSRINDAMAKSYDHYLTILLDKLHSPISTSSQCDLRKLAQNLESIMEQSMQNFSTDFCEPKIELSVRAGHLLSRFADLYQVSSALAPILSKAEQVGNMSQAWDKLDARSVADQCALSCDCKPELLAEIMNNFQCWLVEVEATPSRGNKAIEKLGRWIEDVLKTVQKTGIPSKALVPRVGFITSQVVRDFTLRSDTAFGLFQLVKTWIDDWVSLYMLRQSALSSQSLDISPPTLPEMSVLIPKQPFGIYEDDLSTAVPTSVTQAIDSRHQPVIARTSQSAGVNSGFGLPPSQFLLAPLNGTANQPTTPHA